MGTAVSLLLQRRGHRVVGVASRTAASAEAAGERLAAPVVSLEALPRSDVVLLGVPDHALQEVVRRAAAALAGRVVVHLAGSVGVEPLRGATDAAALCALHPVQACPDVDTALARLPESAWGVTCSAGAEPWAARLIEEDLGGTPIEVREEDRPLWHAAAVTTSNGISALMATGEALLESIGVDLPGLVLGPIAAGTVANARQAGGGAAALTGPVVRGESDVITRHLDAVSRHAPDLVDGYLHALRSIVAGARVSGRIDARDERVLMSLLMPR